MKKALCIISAAILMLAAASCGKGAETPDTAELETTAATEITTEIVLTAAPTTAEPTTAETTAPTTVKATEKVKKTESAKKATAKKASETKKKSSSAPKKTEAQKQEEKPFYNEDGNGYAAYDKNGNRVKNPVDGETYYTSMNTAFIYCAPKTYDPHCPDCGKIEGDGRNGTCRKCSLCDVTCEFCGTFIKCGTCHTCK